MTLLSSVFILHCLAKVSVVFTSSQSNGASSQGRVFWVAQSLDLCGNETPCDTLEGYQRNSMHHLLHVSLNMDLSEGKTLHGKIGHCYLRKLTLYGWEKKSV